MPKRFEVHQGRYGAYFVDNKSTVSDKAMSLEEVAEKLNKADRMFESMNVFRGASF